MYVLDSFRALGPFIGVSGANGFSKLREHDSRVGVTNEVRFVMVHADASSEWVTAIDDVHPCRLIRSFVFAVLVFVHRNPSHLGIYNEYYVG